MTDFEVKLSEVRRLLAEAYGHYFDHSDDGHCKSAEGAISVHYPPFFWLEGENPEPGVSIYSYVLGPSRLHDFASIDAALDEVRRWHREEMEFDHEAAEAEMDEVLARWAADGGN